MYLDWKLSSNECAQHFVIVKWLHVNAWYIDIVTNTTTTADLTLNNVPAKLLAKHARAIANAECSIEITNRDDWSVDF